MRKIFKTFLFVATFLMLPSFAEAATYYVCGDGTTCGSGWTTGSAFNDGLSKATPKLTIASGISTMSGGDTLIIGDGTYENDPVSTPPSGSLGAYTIIKAENTGGPTVRGASTDWAVAALNIPTGRNYIQVEGIRFRGYTTQAGSVSNGVGRVSGNYNKIIRCAFYDAPDDNNMAVFAIRSGATGNLVEECWSWGSGRYKFLVYQAVNSIIRRCVARHDYHGGNDGWAHQEAGFTNYDSTNSLFQNSIVLDSGVEGNTTEEIYGGFWDENNGDYDKTGKIEGSIVLNLRTNHAGILDKVSGNRNISNSVIWDSGGGYSAVGNGGGTTTYGANTSLNNMTIGSLIYTYPGTYSSYGVGTGSPTNISSSTKNSIIYNVHSFGVSGYMISSFNSLYSNSVNYGNGASAGTGDVTNINPLADCLKYLPRTESGCALKTAGEGGTQIGAEILYKHGVSGTLYGESGYDTLTAEPLWPFPNEDLIKTDMASYSGPGPSGARGFATGTSLDGSPQTLTKYIWEYLGNQIPVEIYGISSDVTPPAAPSGLAVQ